MHPYALDLLIRLVFSSHHHPIDGLPIWLSMAIVIGGLYGCLRLVGDVIDFIQAHDWSKFWSSWWPHE